MYGVLSLPGSQVAIIEEAAASDAWLPPVLTAAGKGESKVAAPAEQCVAHAETVAGTR